jgi:hypothetical protein
MAPLSVELTFKLAFKVMEALALKVTMIGFSTTFKLP